MLPVILQYEDQSWGKIVHSKALPYGHRAEDQNIQGTCPFAKAQPLLFLRALKSIKNSIYFFLNWIDIPLHTFLLHMILGEIYIFYN